MNRLFAMLLLVASVSIDHVSAQALKDHLSEKWSTYIGLTTFRTNFKIYNNWIIIGSNGDHLNDPMYMDENAGVKIVDIKTGKIVKTLEEGQFWDTDVNGVEVIGDKLYFGNDNEEFFCYDLRTLDQDWMIRTSGDVECAPAVSDINRDGSKELIIATETGEISAVSAKDGAYLWTYRVPDFAGYASSNTNIVAFKIYTTVSTGTHFYTTPLMDDVNGDGIKDVIASSGDHYTYCINGVTGKLIWRSKGGEYTHSTAKWGNKYLVLQNDNSDVEIDFGRWEFDYLKIFNKKGEIAANNVRVPRFYAGGDFLVSSDKMIAPINDGIAQVDLTTGRTRIIYFADANAWRSKPDGSNNYSEPTSFESAPKAWDDLHIPYITVKTNWKHYGHMSSLTEYDVLPQWEGTEYALHCTDRLIVIKKDFSAIRILNVGPEENKATYTNTETPPMFFTLGGAKYYMVVTTDGNLHLFDLK